MSPVGEELVSIPLGVGLGLNAMLVAVVAVIFNCLPGVGDLVVVLAGRTWNQGGEDCIVVAPTRFAFGRHVDIAAPQREVDGYRKALGYLGRDHYYAMGGGLRNDGSPRDAWDAAAGVAGVDCRQSHVARGDHCDCVGRAVRVVVAVAHRSECSRTRSTRRHPNANDSRNRGK